MYRRGTLLILATWFLVVVSSHTFAWTTVGTGIEYQSFVLPDPNNVYVTRLLRSSSEATIDSSLPQNKLTGARETVRSQSNRLDDAINWWGGSWGQRNDVVAAINGDWIFVETGLLFSTTG